MKADNEDTFSFVRRDHQMIPVLCREHRTNLVTRGNGLPLADGSPSTILPRRLFPAIEHVAQTSSILRSRFNQVVGFTLIVRKIEKVFLLTIAAFAGDVLQVIQPLWLPN